LCACVRASKLVCGRVCVRAPGLILPCSYVKELGVCMCTHALVCLCALACMWVWVCVCGLGWVHVGVGVHVIAEDICTADKLARLLCNTVFKLLGTTLKCRMCAQCLTLYCYVCAFPALAPTCLHPFPGYFPRMYFLTSDSRFSSLVRRARHLAATASDYSQIA